MRQVPREGHTEGPQRESKCLGLPREAAVRGDWGAQACRG